MVIAKPLVDVAINSVVFGSYIIATINWHFLKAICENQVYDPEKNID